MALGSCPEAGLGSPHARQGRRMPNAAGSCPSAAPHEAPPPGGGVVRGTMGGLAAGGRAVWVGGGWGWMRGASGARRALGIGSWGWRAGRAGGGIAKTGVCSRSAPRQGRGGWVLVGEGGAASEQAGVLEAHPPVRRMQSPPRGRWVRFVNRLPFSRSLHTRAPQNLSTSSVLRAFRARTGDSGGADLGKVWRSACGQRRARHIDATRANGPRSPRAFEAPPLLCVSLAEIRSGAEHH